MTASSRSRFSRRAPACAGLAVAILIPGAGAIAQVAQPDQVAQPAHFAGFDRNDYPGDTAISALRSRFAYTGYWLSPPPGERASTWLGRREYLRGLNYGFLLLWNGRLAKDLAADAAALGTADGRAAAEAARRERFPAGAIIFLDQEEGGRLTPAQAAYVAAWTAAVGHEYRAGVYASGIDVPDGRDSQGRPQTISTVRDLHIRLPDVALWVADDACPPAPGCSLANLGPADSGVPSAAVWQYAQSPGRPAYNASCRATYAADGMCYAAGVFVDLNTASTPDPSHGR